MLLLLLPDELGQALRLSLHLMVLLIGACGVLASIGRGGGGNLMVRVGLDDLLRNVMLQLLASLLHPILHQDVVLRLLGPSRSRGSRWVPTQMFKGRTAIIHGVSFLQLMMLLGRIIRLLGEIGLICLIHALGLILLGH